jgi:uncharacterized membrane protein
LNFNKLTIKLIIGALFVFIKRLYNKALKFMNLKRVFGTILTVLGIIGLIYAGIGIVNHNEGFTTLIVVGVIGVIFFFTGISLVRNTTDEAK